jgi:hypothetical protein
MPLERLLIVRFELKLRAKSGQNFDVTIWKAASIEQANINGLETLPTLQDVTLIRSERKHCPVLWGVTIRRGMVWMLNFLHLHTLLVIIALPLIFALYCSLLQTLVSSSIRVSIIRFLATEL